MSESELGDPIGEIKNFYSKVMVAHVLCLVEFKPGMKIRIRGAGMTDFEQEVKSMQIDRKEIDSAAAGQEIGLKVDQRVRKGDKIYSA
ncbi:MAG: translation elongation factor-like protein [Candidatus Hodarchaeales archaeon]|jgi:putative protease